MYIYIYRSNIYQTYRLVWLFPITPAPQHLVLDEIGLSIMPPKEKERFHARAKFKMTDISLLSSANMFSGYQVAGNMTNMPEWFCTIRTIGLTFVRPFVVSNWMMFEQLANACRKKKCVFGIIRLFCPFLAKTLPNILCSTNRIISKQNDRPLPSMLYTWCLSVCTLHHVPLSAQPIWFVT